MPEPSTTDFGTGSQIMQRLLTERAAQKAQAATWAEAGQYIPPSVEEQKAAGLKEFTRWSTAADNAINQTKVNTLNPEQLLRRDAQIRNGYEQIRNNQAKYQEQQLEEIRTKQQANQKSARPTSATPPATPKTSGSGLGMNMRDSPASGSPRVSVGAPSGSAINSPPTGLPKVSAEINAVQSLARNAAAGGAVVGVTDFVYQVASGRPVVDAAGHATFSGVGSAAGTILGATAGSVVGPVGAYVGGMVGGMVGGTLGGMLYDQLFPRPAQPLIEPYLGKLPFSGGQSNVSYRFLSGIASNGSRYFAWIGPYENATLKGPITSIRPSGWGRRYNNDYDRWFWQICNATECVTVYNLMPTIIDASNTPTPHPTLYPTRYDDLPDTGGNPPLPPLVIDNPTYTQINNQITYTIPRAEPASGQTPAPAAYAPSSLNTRENGNSRGDSPEWVKHGGLSGTPHPNNAPLLISPLPYTAPTSNTDPSSINNNQLNPFGGTVQVNADGSVTFITNGKSSELALPSANQSGSLQPSNSNSNNYTSTPTQPIPSFLPQTTKSTLEPDATKKIPSVPSQSTTPITTKDAVTKDDFEQFKKDLTGLISNAAILAGLTPVIQTIGDRVTKTVEQTTPEALRDASKQGSCDAFAPTGCNADIRDNAQRAAQKADDNNKILEALKNLLSGFNFALIQQTWQNTLTINNKLGAALPGGLSGALVRLSKSLGIDRVFNLINFMANLHNASMLSASLKVTLLEMLSSVGNATGLLQTSEGDNVDLNSVFNQGIEKFITSLIGVDAWASMKTTWRKYNSIYRAATNSLNAVSSMFNSIGDALETTAEHTGKIGNAIRAAGLVRENAYNFMAEKLNVKTSKFMTFQSKVGSVTQVLETVNEIAENIIEGQQQYTEAVKATNEFREALILAPKSDGVDNKLIKEEAAKIKENTLKDPTGEDETGLLSFLTDL